MIDNPIRRGGALQMSRGRQTHDNLLRFASCALVLLTVWSYWPTIVVLFKDWQGSDDYSACQLVPPVALYLVWRERKTLGKCLLRPCWPGIALLILAQAARTYGLLFMYESAERYSLVLTIASLVLIQA